MSTQPKRGDIWIADFGGEVKSLPVLVISSDSFNQISASTVIVVPILPEAIGSPSRVAVNGAGVNIEPPAFAACEQIRSIKKDRLLESKGMVAHTALEECEKAITRLIGLKPLPQPRGWGV